MSSHTEPRRGHPLTRLLAAVAWAAVPALIAGCNVITPVAYAIHGPGKVEPAFSLELDETQSIVVFVDDPSSRVAQRRLRYSMADVATRTLLEKKVVVDAIDSRTILNAATKERYGEKMSISELGKAVGADFVIYAVVTNFSMTPSEGAVIPTCQMRVKVIDVASAQRVWPESEAGHLLDVRIRERPSTTGPEGKTDGVENELAAKAGLGLAQLFYKHEITETVLYGR